MGTWNEKRTQKWVLLRLSIWSQKLDWTHHHPILLFQHMYIQTILDDEQKGFGIYVYLWTVLVDWRSYFLEKFTNIVLGPSWGKGQDGCEGNLQIPPEFWVR